MTGLYPAQTQVNSKGPHFRKFIPSVTTLPRLLKQAGYITARVGKIYHYGVPSQIGTPQERCGLLAGASQSARTRPQRAWTDSQLAVGPFRRKPLLAFD